MLGQQEEDLPQDTGTRDDGAANSDGKQLHGCTGDHRSEAAKTIRENRTAAHLSSCEFDQRFCTRFPVVCLSCCSLRLV